MAYHFPETKGIDSYKDITPRLGLAYDVFGNGRTAVKMNFGRYLEGVGVQLNYANTNPTTRIPTNTGPFGVPGVTRTWTDANGESPARLRSAESAGQRRAHATGGDFCGQISNLRFGQPVLTGNYDPDVLSGWGVRAGDWSFGVSVQQQLLARMSLEVGYYRRSFDGFTRERQPAGAAVRLTAPTASPRHRIRGCPTAADTRSTTSTTSVPALSGQVDKLATLAKQVREAVSGTSTGST